MFDRKDTESKTRTTIAISSSIAERLGQIMIEENRPSISNTAENLLKKAIENREVIESQ